MRPVVNSVNNLILWTLTLPLCMLILSQCKYLHWIQPIPNRLYILLKTVAQTHAEPEANFYHTCQVRIQDLVKGGGPASEAESCRHSEASIPWLGSRSRLRALEAFGFLMLKYAFSHILETLFLLFLTSISTPKVDKNRALDFTSINLRHSDMLHLFFNLHEKVML